MNLSLHRLKKKLNLNKKAQGNLLVVLLGGVVLSVLIASITYWYLSLNNNINISEESMTSQSIAQDQWDKIINGDFKDQRNKAGTTEVETVGGYTVEVKYGSVGSFSNGTCDLSASSGSDLESACMNTTITVKDKNGNTLYIMNPIRLGSQGVAVQNDSYEDNRRVSLKYETAKDESGNKIKNSDGSDKMIINGYVDNNKVDFGENITVKIVNGKPVGELNYEGEVYEFDVFQ